MQTLAKMLPKFVDQPYADSDDDIQEILDEYTERAVTIRPIGTIIPSVAIKLGNTTQILGENANLTEQSTLTYRPRPIIDFSASAIDGFITDSAVAYRCQKTRLQSITIKGSGYTNGKSGVKYQSSVGGTPGLAELIDVYIEDFQISVNAGNIDDSHKYIRSHFMRFTNAIKDLNQQTIISQCVFWNALAAGSIGINVKGTNNVITECEFEQGDGSEADETGVAVSLEATSNSNIVSANRFQHAIGTYLQDYGLANVINGNIFNPYETTITRFIRLAGTGAAVIGNTFLTAGTVSSDAILINTSQNIFSGNVIRRVQDAVNCILINGNNNVINGNMFVNCTGCLSNVKLTAGATENILIGEFPNGITDLGTRTIINGVSKNNGNPASTGDWNGSAAKAYRLGITVEDYSSNPSKYYRADSQGNWVQLG